HQGYRLCLTAARLDQNTPSQIRDSEREEQAVKIRLESARENPGRSELVLGQARPDQPGRRRVQLARLWHTAHTAALSAVSSIHWSSTNPVSGLPVCPR